MDILIKFAWYLTGHMKQWNNKCIGLLKAKFQILWFK